MLLLEIADFSPIIFVTAVEKQFLKVLESQGIKAIALTPNDTLNGSIELISDLQKCADLFKLHKDEIDGVLVTLPNFGDERAVANASVGRI